MSTHQLRHSCNAQADENIGRLVQTSRVVQNFYRALESGELYSDDQWMRWQQVHCIMAPQAHRIFAYCLSDICRSQCRCCVLKFFRYDLLGISRCMKALKCQEYD